MYIFYHKKDQIIMKETTRGYVYCELNGFNWKVDQSAMSGIQHTKQGHSHLPSTSKYTRTTYEPPIHIP